MLFVITDKPSIITDKANTEGDKVEGVGVMKDGIRGFCQQQLDLAACQPMSGGPAVQVPIKG